MNPLLLNVAIEEVPAVIAWLKDAFAKKHPDQAEPTEAEVLVAFEEAFESSRAKDDAWLAAHPEE